MGVSLNRRGKTFPAEGDFFFCKGTVFFSERAGQSWSSEEFNIISRASSKDMELASSTGSLSPRAVYTIYFG